MAIQTVPVVGKDGLRGAIESPQLLDDPRTMSVPIRLENGSEIWVPAHLLSRQSDGSYLIDASLGVVTGSGNPPQAGLDRAVAAVTGRTNVIPGSQPAPVNAPTATSANYEQPAAWQAQAVDTDQAAVVPVIEETVDVGKRKVDTGVVHVTKSVQEREEVVDEPLFREEVKIDRVPVGKVVDGPQEIRQEGDTTIVPLLEEVLVVEKRLMLKEELHITRIRWERHEQQRVALRREEANVERAPASQP